mgnify:CR=1 FL=1
MFQESGGQVPMKGGGPLLHSRIPGAESEMSAFSKNDDGNGQTKLPDIGGRANAHA